MKYCYKCGNQITRINDTHTCEQCGSHIYGEKDLESEIENTNNTELIKTNEQILSEFVKSEYYKFNKETLEDVLEDINKVGRYSTELWLYDKQKESNTEPLCCSFKLLYNLILPEPDGSSQVIDMLVITKYCLFVFDIQNQINSFYTSNWSNAKAVINDEERFSPIIENEMHISALRFALFRNAKRNIQNSPAIRPMNVIITAPHAKINIPQPYNDWDKFTFQSLDVNILNGYNLTNRLNIIIHEMMSNNYTEYIDVDEICELLSPYCECSDTKRIWNIKNSNDNDNIKNYSWYYTMVVNSKDNGGLIRRNAKYIQMYIPNSNVKWIFMKDISRVKIQASINDMKTVLNFKKSLDKYGSKMRFTPAQDEKNNIKKDTKLDESLSTISQRDIKDKIMFCSNCGEKIEEDAIFCAYCGAKIE